MVGLPEENVRMINGVEKKRKERKRKDAEDCKEKCWWFRSVHVKGTEEEKK